MPQKKGPLKPAETLESLNWPVWACGKFVARTRSTGSSELTLYLNSKKGEGMQGRTLIWIQIFVYLYRRPVIGPLRKISLNHYPCFAFQEVAIFIMKNAEEVSQDRNFRCLLLISFHREFGNCFGHSPYYLQNKKSAVFIDMFAFVAILSGSHK